MPSLHRGSLASVSNASPQVPSGKTARARFIWPCIDSACENGGYGKFKGERTYLKNSGVASDLLLCRSPEMHRPRNVCRTMERNVVLIFRYESICAIMLTHPSTALQCLAGTCTLHSTRHLPRPPAYSGLWNHSRPPDTVQNKHV